MEAHESVEQADGLMRLGNGPTALGSGHSIRCLLHCYSAYSAHSLARAENEVGCLLRTVDTWQVPVGVHRL